MQIAKIKILALSLLLIFLAAAPILVLPSELTPVSASRLPPGHAATFAGPASRFLLKGPIKVTPSILKPSAVKPASFSIPKQQLPILHPRAGSSKEMSAASVKPKFTTPPVVHCPFGSGCYTVGANTATTNPLGLNAVDSGGLTTNIFMDIEPPDQALCAGNGYVMEVLNIGELRVFNTGLAPVSGDISLDNLMGLTNLPSNTTGGVPTIGWSSGGDISCLYDYDNGGHWFVTEIVSNSSEALGGTFVGCFAAAYEGCFEGVAVSVTNNPLGAYNVFFVNPNYPGNTDPGEGHLLNDFGKIATTRDAFLLFYDEFNLAYPEFTSPCPSYGCEQFNGAQEWAFTKKALELGFPTTSAYFNAVLENMGTDPSLYTGLPDGSCFTGPGAGVACWYQVIPAQSPDPAQFDNSFGGSGFMLGTADFNGFTFAAGTGDNRVAQFYWYGLSNLLSYDCRTCNGIGFGTQTPIATAYSTPYSDEGLPSLAGPPWRECYAYLGNPCGLAPQRAGPTPLGDSGLSNSPPYDIHVNDSLDCPSPSYYTFTLSSCSVGTFSPTEVWATNITASSTGTLQQIDVNLENGGGNIRVAIYAAPPHGPPTGKPLAISNIATATTGVNELTMPYVTITAGDVYWLEFQLQKSASCTGANSCVYYVNLGPGYGSYSHAQATFGAFSQYTTGWAPFAGGSFNMTMTYFPEGGIQTNNDGFTQVSYAQNTIWGAVSTLVTQVYPFGSETHVGAAFWAFSTTCYNTLACGGTYFTPTGQGYVTAAHEDMEFASIAASDTTNSALMAFTLSGNGGPYEAPNWLPADSASCSTLPTSLGQCGYYPSTAYGLLTASGLSGGGIHIADLGQSPQDGFTEYQNYGNPTPFLFRPRWGDYSWAIFVPAGQPGGNNFYFATNYIQSPNCSDSAFLTDPSCLATRDPFANWGSSINYVK